MIRVCPEHHGILNEMKRRTNISSLTREGLEKTKAKGTILGGLIKISPETIRLLIADRVYHTLDWCSAKYGYDRNTICRSIKKYDEDYEAYIKRYEGQAVARQIVALKSAAATLPDTPSDTLPNPSPTVSDSDTQLPLAACDE